MEAREGHSVGKIRLPLSYTQCRISLQDDYASTHFLYLVRTADYLNMIWFLFCFSAIYSAEDRLKKKHSAFPFVAPSKLFYLPRVGLTIFVVVVTRVSLICLDVVDM